MKTLRMIAAMGIVAYILLHVLNILWMRMTMLITTQTRCYIGYFLFVWIGSP